MLSLLFLVAPTLAANCGTSTIPFSFEVHPDGSTSLGCARPTCFGWDGSGEWASQDHSFTEHNGRADGFLRPAIQRRPAFNSEHPSVLPQTVTNCLPSAVCQSDHWVGGFTAPAGGAPSSMICCWHEALVSAESQGIATVNNGQIVIGGEVETDGSPTHFDYIKNIQLNEGGNGYSVELGRMQCRDPPALAQDAVSRVSFQSQQPVAIPQEQPVVVPQQPVIPPSAPVAPAAPSYYYYYPVATASWWCFAADSTVTLSDGSERRMDELSVSDYVQVPSEDMKKVENKPVHSWLHKLSNVTAEFLMIKSTSGKTIKITARHFIFKGDCNAATSASMVTADEVKVGDCLYHANSQKSIRKTIVTEITKVRQQGIYAPLTTGGKIIVDRIAASCHSEVAQNMLVQTMHKNFVHCDTNELSCVLKESLLNLAMDVTGLIFPKSS